MGIQLGLLSLAELLLCELWGGEGPGTGRAQGEEGRTAPAPPTCPSPLAGSQAPGQQTCSVTLITQRGKRRPRAGS